MRFPRRTYDAVIGNNVIILSFAIQGSTANLDPSPCHLLELKIHYLRFQSSPEEDDIPEGFKGTAVFQDGESTPI